MSKIPLTELELPPGPPGDLTPEAAALADEALTAKNRAEEAAEQAEEARNEAVSAVSAAIAEQDIPGQVRVAFESEPTIVAAVTAAAGPAVTAEIAGRPILEGGATAAPDPIFAVVDEDGRRTWIEADESGRPTERAAELIVEKVAAPIGAEVAESLGLEDQSEDVSGVAFAVVDEDGRRTELEVGVDGKLTPRVITSIHERLPPPEIGAQLRSGPDIVAIGDSMTAGAGGNGVSYRSVLGALSGRTVHNEGVGGENSVTITARMGATPFVLDFLAGQIPASVEATPISVRPIRGVTPNPLRQGGGSGDGWVVLPDGSSVRGRMTRSGEQLFFTRLAAGPDIPMARPVAFKWDRTEARRGDIAIIWIGQNGPSNERAIEDARAIVQHLTPLDKRFLVIPRPTSTPAQDDAWLAEFGDRVVLARQYLVEYGLDDAGITPTEEDQAAITAGTIPPSLRIDNVHWNAAGYTILGHLTYRKLIELGDI